MDKRITGLLLLAVLIPTFAISFGMGAAIRRSGYEITTGHDTNFGTFGTWVPNNTGCAQTDVGDGGLHEYSDCPGPGGIGDESSVTTQLYDFDDYTEVITYLRYKADKLYSMASGECGIMRVAGPELTCQTEIAICSDGIYANNGSSFVLVGQAIECNGSYNGCAIDMWVTTDYTTCTSDIVINDLQIASGVDTSLGITGAPLEAELYLPYVNYDDPGWWVEQFCIDQCYPPLYWAINPDTVDATGVTEYVLDGGDSGPYALSVGELPLGDHGGGVWSVPPSSPTKNFDLTTTGACGSVTITASDSSSSITQDVRTLTGGSWVNKYVNSMDAVAAIKSYLKGGNPEVVVRSFPSDGYYDYDNGAYNVKEYMGRFLKDVFPRAQDPDTCDEGADDSLYPDWHGRWVDTPYFEHPIKANGRRGFWTTAADTITEFGYTSGYFDFWGSSEDNVPCFQSTGSYVRQVRTINYIAFQLWGC